jgi:hypothetical protein
MRYINNAHIQLLAIIKKNHEYERKIYWSYNIRNYFPKLRN